MENMRQKEIILTPVDNNIFDFCPNCEKEQSTIVNQVEETYNVRGEKIIVDAQVRYCTVCDQPLFDEELDTININRAYDLYRLKNNYLTPEEIEVIRSTYGLSQRGFATLLDWSPSTVARYETGAIPSPSHYTTLIMFRDNFEVVKDMFLKKKHQLGKLDLKRMSKKIEQIENDIKESDIVDLLIRKYKKYNNDILSGFGEFDFNKLSNIIIHLTSSIPKVSKTKLMKLLFYSDFRHYKEYGLSISGLVYQHLPYGPVPYHHWLMLDALTESQVIELKPFQDFEGEYIEPILNFDSRFLTEEEITTLNRVINDFNDFTAAKISEYSHEEDAYKETKEHEIITYEHADTLRDF